MPERSHGGMDAYCAVLAPHVVLDVLDVGKVDGGVHTQDHEAILRAR